MKKIGILGCGAITRHSHIPAWLSCDDVRIEALCDTNKENMDSLADRFSLHCPRFTSLEDMLANIDIDVVDICTPGFLHYEQARACLLAHKHVLVEKPPVLALEHAQDLIEVAQHSGVKIGTVFNFRYYDIMLRAKKYVDNGLVGKITRMSIVHHGGNIYCGPQWMWREMRQECLLYDFGIHFLDAAVHLCGPHAEVLDVRCFESTHTREITGLNIDVAFMNRAVAHIDLGADMTQHSSHITEFSIYGTAMDMFIRRFPPAVRLVAGIPNPLDILGNDIKAVWDIGSQLLRSTFLSYRNISHLRVIRCFNSWIQHNTECPLSLTASLPTIKLLNDIKTQIPVPDSYKSSRNVRHTT